MSIKRFAALVFAALVFAAMVAAGPAAAQDPAYMAPPGSGQPPDYVLVYDFAVTAQDVQLDDGVLATARRSRPHLLGLFDQPSPDQQQLGIARSMADALAADLTDALVAKGLRAGRAAQSPPPTTATVIVNGRFLSLDEGAKAQRLIIGFGAGQSGVALLVEVDQNNGLLARFEMQGTSGHKPGALVALAGGPASLIAAGGARAVLEQTNPTLARDVKQAAGKIADQVVAVGRQQGWLR